MMFKTHLAFGILLGLIAIPYLNPGNVFLFILIVGIAAGLPDLDSPDSKFGRKIKIIGWVFDHRGIFHSLIGTALFTVLVFAISRSIVYSAAFFIGYISHIIVDSFNKEGTMPLYPIKWRLRGFMKTGGLLESVFFVGFLGAAGYMLLRNYLF
ncbi:metal-dependent hydrolase [candidate division KSB1 bacterium]